MSWDIDTSSSTSATYTGKYTDTYRDYVPTKKPKSSNFKSKAMEQLAKSGVITGKVALFGSRGSPAFNDYDALYQNNIRVYYSDPVVNGYDGPPKLFQYDYAVIIDAFEYIPELMGKANLIKEALTTLQSKNAYIIMMARTIEMVNKLAKDKKYKAVDDRFLITNNNALKGLTMKGVEAEELIMIAHFAGANAGEIDRNVKTDMVCVRAYPSQ
jgi:hypothetical protein